MMTRSTVLLHLVVAIAWATSVEGTEVLNTEATTEYLHPSSPIPFENLPTPTATGAFHSSNTEHSLVILTTSQDTKTLSTVPVSIATPQTNIEITSTPTSPLIETTEVLQTTETFTTPPITSHVDTETYISPEAETSIGSSEAVLPSLDTTHYQGLETSISIPPLSQAEIGSTTIYNPSKLFESTPAMLGSDSTAFEDPSSGTVDQMASSQRVGPTKTSATVATATPKSVTDRPTSKSTSSKSPTKGSLQNSNEQLAPGAKIAVGVIVTLCILGVILAAVVLYRRFNITHRSLKSFLTSGVRYKTYKNATYKDDEGMLIMPDRR